MLVKLLVITCVVTTGVASLAAEQVVLVEAGRPRAVLVLPADPQDDESLAARELQDHIRQISGATLPITTGRPTQGMLPVRIGSSLAPDLKKRVAGRSPFTGAFVLSVKPQGIRLAGNSAEGTLFAAYELLEQLGCRWYLPGPVGTVVPKASTVALPVRQTFQAPSFKDRHLIRIAASVPWYRRQRLGGLFLPNCHGIPQLPESKFEDEPELWALIDGKRRPTQLCTTEPKVLRRAIAATLRYFEKNPDVPWIGMGPDDNGEFCECERCCRLDTGQIDPISNRLIRTDRYIWFFNQVLDAVHKKLPGKKLCFYAYDSRKFTPTNHQPNPLIVPAFAPITQCRLHGMSNPMCPDRSYYRTIIADWAKISSEMYERGYYFNLACPGFPFSKIQAIRDETVEAHKLGMTGWTVECMPSWASHGPTLYVASRLMWDVDTDVDALLAEFCEKFFGPAARPMLAYLHLVDRAYRDTDVHTGSSFCMPRLFPPERMAKGRTLLNDAAKQTAGNDLLVQRVRIFRLNYDQLDAFLRMLDERNRFDFAAAASSLKQLRGIITTMLDWCLYPPNTPPYGDGHQSSYHHHRLVWPKAGRSYLNRFWTEPVETGFHHTVTNGEFVAGAPDEWDFLIDPTGVGEGLRWYRDGRIGGNWQRLRTTSATWSDQGLHYYKGLAWYRTNVAVPRRFQNRKLFLWFGGIDEVAKVWLNGKLLGQNNLEGGRLIKTAGTFKSFDFRVTDLVRFDRPNTIAVKITSRRLSEIGTGGITGPVMFWSPK